MSVTLTTDSASQAFQAALEHRRELVLEIDGRDYDTDFPGWRGRYRAYYDRVFGRGDGACLSHSIDGVVAGSCIVSVLDDFRRTVTGRGTAYVNAMFVEAAFRRRGIARKLLDAAIAWGKEHGCTTARLHPSPVSREAYRAYGFIPIDEYELRLT